ncbi:diguanylate cyclase/phosphodiesterase with GAF sensor [Rhizobium sp. CF080]|uniref:EAL domain-containing protein n=1 Tax=Rhizobium sp. (strain CF080) TaxID=1144310 RepID=UPI0002715E25|nr:diguanylate cyclase/phosphodiesterase with GAF sensor [Rhizobium sp. CF080]
MSIRYKFFGAFSIVVALACGLAFYGIRSISSTGDLVVNLYDGPLMGINYARSAHAALNEARLLLQPGPGEAPPKETAEKFEKLLADIADNLQIVRERVKTKDVTVALERAESRLRDWSDAELQILQPPTGGLTTIPAPFAIARKSEATVAALDDLVEIVAAYGFDYRMQAEAKATAARATMLTLAVGAALAGLMLAIAFAYSMSKPIFAAMRVAERVATGNFTDKIDIRRRDELGRLLNSLVVMQTTLKARADDDEAARISKERLTRMLAALNATNEAIMRAKTREQLFEFVCKAAIAGAKFTSMTIALAEPGNEFLRIAAATGPGAKVQRGQRIATSNAYPEGRGLSGIAFRAKRPCISNDYLADVQSKAFHEAVRRTGTKSGAALPLLSQNQAAGVLLFLSAEIGTFTPEFVDLLQRLAANVSFALEGFDRADEKEKAEERIKYLATHDTLTDLPNRAMFNQLLGFSMQEARRYERHCAVLFIDLDRFKIINDTLGHAAGDALLIEVARRLRSGVRKGDVVARLGGDEFVILLNEITEIQHVATIARNLLASVSKTMDLGGHECGVTASIGIAMFPEDGDNEQTLMKNADIAMYLAKQEGKNDIRFFSTEIATQSVDRLMLEAGLRHALDRNQFCLHYQPKLDVVTGRIAGVEALLRWNHPELGMLPPMRFIPLAEETGLIVAIGRWVLKTACAQNMAWQRQGLPPLSMAVNVSPRQFLDENLLRDIDDVLAATGMNPNLLQIEITESMVMLNVDRAIQLLDSIQSRGVRLAIDDFGTGYSSMSLMKQFPIDTIKIDRSFVRDLPHGSEDKAITQAIIAMGKALGLTVVAEGVETKEQSAFLTQNACDEIQGFLFSKPVPSEDIADLLRLQHVDAPSLQPELSNIILDSGKQDRWNSDPVLARAE